MPLTHLTIATSGPGLYEFTRDAIRFVDTQASATGLLTIFLRHTSASLLIQEIADPDVQADLQAYFARLAPHADDPAMHYLTHRTEGPDDMPAHIRAALTQTALSVPVEKGELLLGTWQGIYLFEHRARPHRRNIVLHLAVDADG